jgi:hypothetical protein
MCLRMFWSHHGAPESAWRPSRASDLRLNGSIVPIGASREQTVCMGKAGSAVSGIFGFVLRDSAMSTEH